MIRIKQIFNAALTYYLLTHCILQSFNHHDIYVYILQAVPLIIPALFDNPLLAQIEKLNNVVEYFRSQLADQGRNLKSALEDKVATNDSLRSQLSSTMASLNKLRVSAAEKDVCSVLYLAILYCLHCTVLYCTVRFLCLNFLVIQHWLPHHAVP